MFYREVAAAAALLARNDCLAKLASFYFSANNSIGIFNEGWRRYTIELDALMCYFS